MNRDEVIWRLEWVRRHDPKTLGLVATWEHTWIQSLPKGTPFVNALDAAVTVWRARMKTQDRMDETLSQDQVDVERDTFISILESYENELGEVQEYYAYGRVGGPAAVVYDLP